MVLSEKKDKQNTKSKVVLISKPYASCQGRGIKLITHISEIPTEGKFIIQKYINKYVYFDLVLCSLTV